ncbi:MAG: NUDIX hydrolase [Bacteroidota bacterium]
MYKIEFSDFFTSAFSVDCLIFGFTEGKIKTLLIKRSIDPYKDYWAIPGDLVYPDEDLPFAAERILRELTGLTNVQMHQAHTFGSPSRHPQGRVITIAYYALVRIEELSIKASSWADEVRWEPVLEVGNLAFDHNEILEATFDRLNKQLSIEPICFELLPEKFTLNEFQQLFEYSKGIAFDKANFRKKIKGIPLVKHTEKQINVKHRPANLFSFDFSKEKERLDQSEWGFKM